MSLISAETVPEIQDLMPADSVQSVTLYPRAADSSSASAFGTGVTYTARWKPLSDETIAILGGAAEQQWREWQLYQTASQSTIPAPGSKIVDASGVIWYVKSVQTKQFGKIHNCRSYKEAT